MRGMSCKSSLNLLQSVFNRVFLRRLFQITENVHLLSFVKTWGSPNELAVQRLIFRYVTDEFNNIAELGWRLSTVQSARISSYEASVK